MTVTPINNQLFDVTSERDETRTYVVEAGKSCTCPHHQARGAYCKHMRQVDTYLSSQTKLQQAAVKAKALPDADLLRLAKAHNGEVAGAACLLELAQRKLQQQPKEIPAGVLALLDGATDAERERALSGLPAMRPKGAPLTQREIENAARLLAVLLPLSFEERIDILAIVCRALWDGRLNEPDFTRSINEI